MTRIRLVLLFWLKRIRSVEEVGTLSLMECLLPVPLSCISFPSLTDLHVSAIVGLPLLWVMLLSKIWIGPFASLPAVALFDQENLEVSHTSFSTVNKVFCFVCVLFLNGCNDSPISS